MRPEPGWLAGRASRECALAKEVHAEAGVNEECDSMSDTNEVVELVQRYFDATWRGDVAQLRTVFDPRAIVAGEVNGQPYYKTIDEYLAGVASRKSPAERGEKAEMELLMLDVQHNIATAKLHVRMLGFNYYNYFSIMRQQDKWLVITKTLTNVQ
ncbi:MAG TPA: nuclear transport factor 2 family protein [Paraburkholderia sp.]|uniref:nuclear transport factor 2 family protein n=1 Tax=Paraburkholderia sp. TaxID=1926495 RepID=UPI002CFC0DC6|nr:nuclear transport factor 2 family protein [Paraburkholderia sp.]HTR06302.1 nuclear transport factor 2 family protein [Paraburkholderia sp.]